MVSTSSHLECEIEGRTDHSRLLQSQLRLDVIPRRVRFPLEGKEPVTYSPPD